jgi:hypothetical protein
VADGPLLVVAPMTFENAPTVMFAIIAGLLLANILLVRSPPRSGPSQRKGKGH